MITRVARLVGLVLLILVLLGMLGFVPPSLRSAGEWIWARWGPTTGGLVYVESPEVYTRQRLVNDRYLQDSWLRGKLRELDADGTLLISERVAEAQGLTARLTAAGPGEAPKAGAAPEAPALPQVEALPFDVRFALQSALRDKIRQLILENALDDRHDLSGNTVYGLKFDTAVIPGSDTFQAPAVIVRVVDENLKAYRDASRVAALYLRSNQLNFSQIDPTDREIVRTMDRHFNRWRENLEKRLNEYKSELTPDCSAERTDPALQTSVYEIPICAVEDGRIVPVPGLIADVLPALLPQAETIDQALDYELRVPPRETNHGAVVLPWIAGQVQQACNDLNRALVVTPQTSEGAAPPAAPDLMARTLGDPKLLNAPVPTALVGSNQESAAAGIPRSLGALLDGLKGASPPVTPLPGPWGELFNLRLGVRAPDSNRDVAGQCTIPVDLTLLEREIGLIVLDEQAPKVPAETMPAAVLGKIQNANWASLLCEAESCLGTPPQNSVWVDIRYPDARALTKLTDLLDQNTLEALIDGVRPAVPLADPCADGGSDQSLWFAQYSGTGPFYIVGSRDPNWQIRAAGKDTGPAQGIVAPTNVVCLPGQAIQFRLGAFRFLQRMTEVDSYIYAAFPRGDVTGVVTETGKSAQLETALPAPGGTGLGLGLTDALRRQRIEARPSIVNFAAGSQDDGFDFGWAITKDGRKEPMIASQLVLVSVPAYLDQIELDVWKGFIDLDGPADGTGDPAVSHPVSAAIAALMRQPASRLTLRIPPDYNALDGIVIGTELLNGPRLRGEKLDNRCFRVTDAGPFTLAIPGDRLWRSTVVTLDGLKADRIEVMPDMRGILATFDPAGSGGDTTTTPPREELASGFHDLIVWTSEGSANARIRLARGDGARCGA